MLVLLYLSSACFFLVSCLMFTVKRLSACVHYFLITVYWLLLFVHCLLFICLLSRAYCLWSSFESVLSAFTVHSMLLIDHWLCLKSLMSALFSKLKCPRFLFITYIYLKLKMLVLVQLSGNVLQVICISQKHAKS